MDPHDPETKDYRVVDARVHGQSRSAVGVRRRVVCIPARLIVVLFIYSQMSRQYPSKYCEGLIMPTVEVISKERNVQVENDPNKEYLTSASLYMAIYERVEQMGIYCHEITVLVSQLTVLQKCPNTEDKTFEIYKSYRTTLGIADNEYNAVMTANAADATLLDYYKAADCGYPLIEKASAKWQEYVDSINEGVEEVSAMAAKPNSRVYKAFAAWKMEQEQFLEEVSTKVMQAEAALPGFFQRFRDRIFPSLPEDAKEKSVVTSIAATAPGSRAKILRDVIVKCPVGEGVHGSMLTHLTDNMNSDDIAKCLGNKAGTVCGKIVNQAGELCAPIFQSVSAKRIVKFLGHKMFDVMTEYLVHQNGYTLENGNFVPPGYVLAPTTTASAPPAGAAAAPQA